MDLTPTTYTAPSSLASSPVAPIYSTWHALAGDFLGLGDTIRALPLDLLATSLGVPVWRTAWPDGVKAQVIAWYGQYGGRLYTRAGLAAFVWIFGGDLTKIGAITDYWETAVLSIEVYNDDGDGGSAEFVDGALWTASYASGDTIKFCANPLSEAPVVRPLGDGVYRFTLTFVALQGGPLANGPFVSFTPDTPDDPAYYVGMPVPVIVDIIEYGGTGQPRTTAATPTSPLAFADDVILSYIGQWMPLGYNLTLDSSAAVIGRTRTIRRIIVTIPSGNPTLVPLGTIVNVLDAGAGDSYFDLVSLDPTDDSTIFTGIIKARTYADGANAPADFLRLQLPNGTPIIASVATAVMDDSIPDGILQYGYPDVVTGDPVLVSGRPGWDAVTVSTRAVLSIEVYNSDGDNASSELLDYGDQSNIWTATYASGDAIKFYANPDNEYTGMRDVGGGVYGFTIRFVALQGGPLANGPFVSFTPDAPQYPEDYDGMPVPVIVDSIEEGTTSTIPAIPAIPALGTPVPQPPFEEE